MALTNFFELLSQSPKVRFEDILRDWNYNADDPSQQAQVTRDFSAMIFKQYKSFENAFEEIEKVRRDPNALTTSQVSVAQSLAFVDDPQYASLDSITALFNQTRPEFNASKDVALSVASATKSLINLSGSFKKEKIIITSDERGIFDFSLASRGLYRPLEFYSSEFAISGGDDFINRGTPKGVIPPEFVDREENAFGYYYTYTDKQKRKFSCERRQVGTTDVFDFFKGKCILKQNEEGITIPYDIKNQDKVFNGEGEHKLKYATSNKKVYLLFDRKEESTKYVDFFIPVNYLMVQDGNRIANALVPILVSLSLEEFGIKTRISAVRNGIDENVYTAVSIPLKTYEEKTLDKVDFLLNLLGQAGVAGSFFAFFKTYNSNEGQVQPDGNVAFTRDNSAAFSDVFYYKRIAMLDLFSRYKNWIEVNKGQDFVETKVKDSNFQVFTFQAVSQGSDLPFFRADLSSDAQGFIENMPYVIYMYFFYIDYLSIQYLSMDKFVNILFKRFEEDENFTKIFTIDKSRDALRQTITSYVTGLLYYRYYSTTTNAYADSQEQKDKKMEDFDKKIDELDDVLNNYSNMPE